MNEEKVNLFIYGSLRDRRIFQSVCGLSFSRKHSKVNDQTLLAGPALLPHYRKVSPDNVYFYAVPASSSRIDGFVIYDVPASAMDEIDRYEGRRYQRETVRVNTANGYAEAQAYLVSHESMRKHFGDRFHVNLIHELWLRKRIEKFIKKHTRPGEKTADAELERRAERELIATTERDLVMSDYRTDAVSDYYLEHEPVLVAQIETPEAVGNAAAIAATEGVDALFLGTDDLKIQAGLSVNAPNLGTDIVVEAMVQVAQAAKGAGKVAGCVAPSPDLMKRSVDLGYQILVGGGDMGLLREACRETIRVLREVMGR